MLAGDEADRRRAVLRTWAWTSALNVDWILAGSDPAETYARYRALHALAAAPSGGPAASGAPGPPPRPAFVLDRPSGPQPYPHPAGAGSGSAAGLLTAAAQLLAPGGGPAPALQALPRRPTTTTGTKPRRSESASEPAGSGTCAGPPRSSGNWPRPVRPTSPASSARSSSPARTRCRGAPPP